jgi:NAD(P)-dependent dehydrogenase (short-subunit alcohol dehydrogenase family)
LHGKNRFLLNGSRILLTGAAGGIGRATATVCAGLGAEMILVDKEPTEDLRGELGNATSYICDVRKRPAVEKLCASLGRVDAAILNAGYNPFGNWTDSNFDDSFNDVMAVNVLGPLNFARSLLPGMIANGSGRLVLVGSIAAFTGGMLPTVPAHYVAAKGGVHGLLHWLARRGGSAVQVNAVAPSVVDTAMTKGQPFSPPETQPIRRKAEPVEIAWPIAFLCSPAASYITGTIIDINGGALFR